MSLRKLGLICGILSPLLWLALIGVAGAMRPEFSHRTHYISELAEHGSSTEFMMRIAAFGFTGFLYVCFALALLATFRDGEWGWRTLTAVLIALDGVGRIGAGVFACDPGCAGFSMSQELHRLFATLGFLAGILATLAWGIACRRHAWSPALSGYSVGSGALALTCLLLMLWTRNPVPAPGLFEHLATLILSLWVLVLAVPLLRSPERSCQGSSRSRGAD
mgnify:CR=1 FL=1